MTPRRLPGAEQEKRKTLDQMNSDQLDKLYEERDEARQHAAAIAAQRDRLRARMNNLADRWDNALAPDKPYARTLRNEISCDPFDPDGAMIVQEYTERGRRLWAFRCWGTDTCDGWLGLGHHTQTSALVERERHVVEAHAEQEAAGQRLDRAEAAIARVRRIEERLWEVDDSRELHVYAVCHSVANDLRAALDEPAPGPAATQATDDQTKEH